MDYSRKLGEGRSGKLASYHVTRRADPGNGISARSGGHSKMGVALFFPHTPSEEQMEEHEQCCKQWPNVPHCNGDYTKAMSLPRCAKLPHFANIKSAERILEEKKKNARSH
jgi:hypothetical protein